MMLSDGAIADLIGQGCLVIDPLDPDNIQPCSVDVHLGDTVRVRQHGLWSEPIHIDPVRGFTLAAHQFVLGVTLERVQIPKWICCFVHGRSSVGRGGLFIENAGLVDPNFRGDVTLELFNALDEPQTIQAGQPIGQLTFVMLDAPARRPYGSGGLKSRYQNQSGPTTPRALP